MTSLQAPSSDTVTLGVRPSCLPLLPCCSICTNHYVPDTSQNTTWVELLQPSSMELTLHGGDNKWTQSRLRDTPDLPLWSQSGPGSHSHPGTPVRRKIQTNSFLLEEKKSYFQRVALEFYYIAGFCVKNVWEISLPVSIIPFVPETLIFTEIAYLQDS